MNFSNSPNEFFAFSALTLLVGRKKMSDEVLAWLPEARCKSYAYGPADATA